MILNRLLLKNFGRFQNKEIFFKEGINVIYGENESGKSTLHSFIQGSFFGIRRMRGRASRTDRYTRYAPWENPGWYQGSVTFTCGGKSFRLERNFARPSEAAVLFCETDGELLSVEDGDLDMLLGNISETAYQNTVSVEQAKSRTEEGLYREIREYLSDFQGSGDLRFDPDRALELLKEKKKVWEKKEKEMFAEKEKAEQEVQYAIYHEQEEIEQVRKRLAELKEPEQENTARQEKPVRTKNTGSSFGQRLLYGLLFAVFAAVSIWVLDLLWLLKYLTVIVVLIWIVFVFLSVRKKPQEVSDYSDLPGKEKIRTQKKLLAGNLAERKIRLENLEEEYREIRENNQEILEIRKEIRCIAAAQSKIQEAAAGMHNLTGSLLQQKMSEIVCSMTEGKYRQVILDEDFHIRLDTGEQCLELYQVSYGTAEQVYLALRLACGEILCREEELPLLLDETFAMYDDKRLFQTLQWLSRRKSQVLLFSCNKREIRALERLGIAFHLVEL